MGGREKGQIARDEDNRREEGSNVITKTLWNIKCAFFLTFINLSVENSVEDQILLGYGAVVIRNLLTNVSAEVSASLFKVVEVELPIGKELYRIRL